MRNGTSCTGVETAGSGLGDISGKGGETNIVVMNEAILLLFAVSAPWMSCRGFPLGQPGNLHKRFLIVAVPGRNAAYPKLDGRMSDPDCLDNRFVENEEE